MLVEVEMKVKVEVEVAMEVEGDLEGDLEVDMEVEVVVKVDMEVKMEVKGENQVDFSLVAEDVFVFIWTVTYKHQIDIQYPLVVINSSL